MKKIALFNHKGGVGKTTLTINIADALSDLGKTVIIADADPQCNITSFFMEEEALELLLGESNDLGSEATIWSAIKPVVEGRGSVVAIDPVKIGDQSIYLLPGDVLLSEYEESLPAAWTDCFARRTRGYDVTTALASLVNITGERIGADFCLYDVGPNIGALNRAILLDCDYFITPVCADLFSLRALSTVGRAITKWMKEWKTVRELASTADRRRLPTGKPEYLGYITSAYKIHRGRSAALPHAGWEEKIEARVRERVISELMSFDHTLVPEGQNKLGEIKHYHSLAPEAQKHGVAIGKLRGHVNPGHYVTVDNAKSDFAALAGIIGAKTN
jgi:cellulose biosynthesis protein BcsQ